MITDTNIRITNELAQATLGAECKQTKSSKLNKFILSSINFAEVVLIEHLYTKDVFGDVEYNSTILHFGKKHSSKQFAIDDIPDEEQKVSPYKYKFITDTLDTKEPTAVWRGITINIKKKVKPYNKYKDNKTPDFGVVYKPNVKSQSLIKSTCPESHVLPTDTEELMQPQYWFQKFNRPVKYKDGVDITETKYFTPESYLINTYKFKKFYQKTFFDAIVALKECCPLDHWYIKKMRQLGQAIARPALILAYIWWSHDSSVMDDIVTWALRAVDVLRDALVPDSFHVRRDDVQHEIEQAIKADLNGGFEKVLKYRLRKKRCCYMFPEGYTEEQKLEFKKLYPKVRKYNRTPYKTSETHIKVLTLWAKGVKESEIAKKVKLSIKRVKNIVSEDRKTMHPEVQEKISKIRQRDERIVEAVVEGKLTRNAIVAQINEGYPEHKINTKYIQRLMKKPWVAEYLKQEEEQKERNKALTAVLTHTEAMRERVDSNGTCDLREFTENNMSSKYDVGLAGA